jgi:actin-related protein
MEKGPLIVDNGSGYIKIGYSGIDAFPRESIASIVGQRILRADSISDNYE